MSPLKIWFRRVHLWLGLGTGLLLMFVCLTGSLLVFEDELEHAWHAERYFVATDTMPPLPLADLLAAVRAAKPKAKISGLKVYADPTRTVEVSLAGSPGGQKGERQGGRGEKPGAAAGGKEKGRKGKGGGGPRVFVNPYTAAITGEFDPRDNFFHTVEELHRGLVAGKTGKLVMGINSLLFVVILLTGLVLWWPSMRKTLKARLRLKWDSGWKRRNHDLHIVLGFYTSAFLLFTALTGVGMSFDWTNKLLASATGSTLQRPEPPASTATGQAVAFSPDALLAQARQQVPQAAYYSLQLPQDPTGSIRVAVLPPGALIENATDEVYIDQYSGQIIGRQTYAQRSLAQRVRGLYKPIHTGAIFGWPTKVLALVITLLGASFPITGTILWLNRRRKKQKKSPPLQVA